MSSVYGFRNTTAYDLVLNTSTTIAVGSTWIFYNSENSTINDCWGIHESMISNPNGINYYVGNGFLVFVIDGLDQTPSTFYSTWKNIIQPALAVSNDQPVHTKPVIGYSNLNDRSILSTKIAKSADEAISTGFYSAPLNIKNTLSVSSLDTLISNCNQETLLCTKPGLASKGVWSMYLDPYGSTINHTKANIGDHLKYTGQLDVSIALLGDNSSHYPYAGVYFDLTNNGASATTPTNKAVFDISSYTGITITYQSTVAFKIQLEGTADNDGANWFYTVPVSASKTTINITWAQFAQPGWVSGVQIRAIPTNKLCGIKFQYDTMQSSCSFTLYSVGFKGTGPFMVSTTSVSQKYINKALHSINTWFDKFYIENDTKTQGRIAWISGTNVDYSVTVSEGIGYGMLLAMIGASSTNTGEVYRKRLDRLWEYYKANTDGNGLMNWKVSGFNKNVIGAGAAPDADVDVAKALLLAYERYMDAKYLTAAIDLMNRIWTFEIMSKTTTGGTKYMFAPGDSWQSYCNPSYSAKLAAVKLFAYYDPITTHNWTQVYTDSIWQLQQNQSYASAYYSLPSNWCDYNGVPVIGSSALGYGWDSCRVLYHMSEAYRMFGDSQAFTYLNNIASNATLLSKITSDPLGIQLSIDPSGTYGRKFDGSVWGDELSSEYNTAALSTILCAFSATSKLTVAQVEFILDTILNYTNEDGDYFRLALKCFVLSEITGLITRYSVDAGSASNIAYIMNIAGPSEIQSAKAQLAIPLDGTSPKYRTYANGVWSEFAKIGGDSGHSGSAVIDFGAWPGNTEASVMVTGQSSIDSTKAVNLQIQSVSTTTVNGTHTISDIRFLSSIIGLSYGAIVPGVGFTIYANSLMEIQGPITVAWSW